MAHTVCGIDLGAYSIKLAFLEAGFRATTLRGLEEIPVPEGEAPLVERQMAAVREGLARIPGEVTPYVAVAAIKLSVRVLELPFTDARKIDQVVGYELEAQIVNAIEDVVFDHLIAAEKADGTTILAAAAKREDLAALIAAAEARGFIPVRCSLRRSSTGRCSRPWPPSVTRRRAPARRCSTSATSEPTSASSGAATPSTRAPSGGAARILTAAIAKAFNANPTRAEQAKRGEAFIASAGKVANTPLLVKLDAILREALAPTIRELRQTLASFAASAKLEIDALLVVGGGGRLAGLLPFLEGELAIPARHPGA